MTPKELAEREGKPIALAWIDASVAALEEHVASRLVDGSSQDPNTQLVTSALATNFSLRAPALGLLPWAWWILGTLRRVRQVLRQTERLFFDVAEDEARALFDGALPPAYAIFDRGVFFTPAFAPFDPVHGTGFGPQCRAAMVLHECVHVIDPRSGEGAIHVSEWDEPRFSEQTPEQSIHNPSAYASFAAQIYTRSLDWPRAARYGAGRPTD